MSDQTRSVNIIGAGLSGLSAAITLARAGFACNLISSQPSERAQSVLAEGGINAALDLMGEEDTVREHFEDTMRGGCWLESPSVIEGLTASAPGIVLELADLGVPFNTENGHLVQRNFGGQKKKRTTYAKSSTGKILMTALIDEVRRYEASGLVTRYSHHELTDIETEDGVLISVTVRDAYTMRSLRFTGCTILCTGGLNGFFEGLTTGTTQNTGNAAAIAFAAGAEMANLEFIQYHPTTVGISNKRMLISEAARGEGGRLFIMRDGNPWYFMEDKYPELGNLMPRDVVSREMTLVRDEEGCSGSVFLDMTSLSDNIWKGRLSDLREEIISYMHIDPAAEPVPVSPGIHYFMGGIRVSSRHETSIRGLYAAGEAACRYHGANRLGGNSMLGAIYGGRIAAGAVQEHASEAVSDSCDPPEISVMSPSVKEELRDILSDGLGILRTAESIQGAYDRARLLLERDGLSSIDKKRVRLGIAMLASAMARKESRGAHTRLDYPDTLEEFRRFTVARDRDGRISVEFVSPDEAPGGTDL